MDSQREQTEAEAWLHDMRKKVDAILKEVNEVRKLPYRDNKNAKSIREIKLAYTKLQEAKMWFGKGLEEEGSPLPAQYRDEA